MDSMRQYLDLLSRVLHEGDPKSDRTGVGTRSSNVSASHLTRP